MDSERISLTETCTNTNHQGADSLSGTRSFSVPQFSRSVPYHEGTENVVMQGFGFSVRMEKKIRRNRKIAVRTAKNEVAFIKTVDRKTKDK